jgi:hypothetical protein
MSSHRKQLEDGRTLSEHRQFPSTSPRLLSHWVISFQRSKEGPRGFFFFGSSPVSSSPVVCSQSFFIIRVIILLYPKLGYVTPIHNVYLGYSCVCPNRQKCFLLIQTTPREPNERGRPPPKFAILPMMPSLNCPPTEQQGHKHTASMLLLHRRMQFYRLPHLPPLQPGPPSNVTVLRLLMLLVLVMTALRLLGLLKGLPLHLLKV